MVRRQLVAFETGINSSWQVANILRETRKINACGEFMIWWYGRQLSSTKLVRYILCKASNEGNIFLAMQDVHQA